MDADKLSLIDNCEMPLVSVGIPTYNRPDGLRRTLKCMCSQTYRNIEIIVSDNATPGSAVERVVHSFAQNDNRIIFFRQSANIGLFQNFQFVLSQARGDFFLWAADDDEWDNRFIDYCITQIGNSGSIMTRLDVVFRATGAVEHSPEIVLDSRLPAYDNALSFLRMMQPGLFYGMHRRKEILFFLDDFHFDFYDCYFVMKLILTSGFQTLPEVLYCAGIDAETYQIKHADSQKKQLNFGYFTFYLLSSIIRANTITLIQKYLLIKETIATINNLIRHHNQSKKAGHTLIRDFLKAAIAKKPSLLSVHSDIPVATITHSENEVPGKVSFSQAGEDMIVDFIFKALEIDSPSYIDIGAYHPLKFSNTYFFYLHGSTGVCIEPDPKLYKAFQDARPKDIILNIGISDVPVASATFYIMSTPTLNTFSKTEAERYQSTGKHNIESTISVPLLTVHQIIQQYCNSICPDFISIDVEGLDYEIVRSIDFSLYRPAVICVETLTFSETRSEVKRSEIISHIKMQDYIVYADTYINTIFVDRLKWAR